MYRTFYPREEKSIYMFFLENNDLKMPCYTESLYEILNDYDDFDINEFMKVMASSIPTFNGFHDADVYMNSFLSHLDDLSYDTIEAVIGIYESNNQCLNRAKHTTDMYKLNKYIEEHYPKEIS